MFIVAKAGALSYQEQETKVPLQQEEAEALGNKPRADKDCNKDSGFQLIASHDISLW